MIHKPTVSWLLCLTISAVPCLQAQQKAVQDIRSVLTSGNASISEVGIAELKK